MVPCITGYHRDITFLLDCFINERPERKIHPFQVLRAVVDISCVGDFHVQKGKSPSSSGSSEAGSTSLPISLLR